MLSVLCIWAVWWNVNLRSCCIVSAVNTWLNELLLRTLCCLSRYVWPHYSFVCYSVFPWYEVGTSTNFALVEGMCWSAFLWIKCIVGLWTAIYSHTDIITDLSFVTVWFSSFVYFMLQACTQNFSLARGGGWPWRCI